MISDSQTVMSTLNKTRLGKSTKSMFEIPSNQEHFFEMEMDDEKVDPDFGLQTTKLAGKDETEEEKVSRNDFAGDRQGS